MSLTVALKTAFVLEEWLLRLPEQRVRRKFAQEDFTPFI